MTQNPQQSQREAALAKIAALKAGGAAAPVPQQAAPTQAAPVQAAPVLAASQAPASQVPSARGPSQPGAPSLNGLPASKPPMPAHVQQGGAQAAAPAGMPVAARPAAPGARPMPGRVAAPIAGPRPAKPDAAMPPRPKDNTGAGAVPPTAAEFAQLADQLRQLMEQEIDCLARHDYNAMADLTERKRVLGGLFKDKQKVMTDHPEVLDSLSGPERKALGEKLRQLHTVGRKNEAAVRGARDGHQRFLNALIKGATKQEQLGTGYSANGKMTTLTANYGAKKPVSIFSNTVA